MRPYRLVPETASQSAILLTWPHAQSAWADTLEAVTGAYIEIARAVVPHQALHIVCYDTQHTSEVSRACTRAGVPLGNIRFHAIPTNDTWIRDYGPLTVSDGDGLRLLDFTFDGWGGKFPAELDNAVTYKLNAEGLFHSPCRSFPIVLEGGSIDTDGQGSLLTTSNCLIAHSRNTDYAKADFERLFAVEMGSQRTLWLDHGELAGDDTDAHIDMLARFCAVDTIAYTQCTDRNEAHYAELKAMEQQLASFTTSEGHPYHLIPLPLPAPVHSDTGERLPASYANFLVINDAVLLPVYGDPADAVATERLAGAFPGRKIVPVDCRPLIYQYGSLHCATMQLPAGVL